MQMSQAMSCSVRSANFSGDGPKLKVVEVDYTNLQHADVAGDVVFCALGYSTTETSQHSSEAIHKTDLKACEVVAHAAQKAGAKHFQCVGTSGDESNNRGWDWHSKRKGEADEPLLGLDFPLGTAVMRPGTVRWKATGQHFENRMVNRGQLLDARQTSSEVLAIDDLAAAMVREWEMRLDVGKLTSSIVTEPDIRKLSKQAKMEAKFRNSSSCPARLRSVVLNAGLQAEQDSTTLPLVMTDADVGADDALSMLIALARSKVLLVTTADGNVRTDVATDNALRLLRAAGYHGIKVGQGVLEPRRKSYFGRTFVDAFPGQSQLSVMQLADQAPKLLFDTALAVKEDHSIVLVLTAPNPNIAQAIEYAKAKGKLDDFLQKFSKVVIMGGLCNPSMSSFKEPNNAEFNLAADVEASRALWNASWPHSVEFYLVPTDPIARTPLRFQDADCVRELAAAGSLPAQAAWKVLDMHLASDGWMKQKKGYEIYDAFAMALALDRSSGSKLVPANVILHSTGQTVVECDDVSAKSHTPSMFVPAAGASKWMVPRRMMVLEDIDYPRFVEMFLTSVSF
eukprot:gnl/TRDRNA2_/TRDRNA2_81146_c0_seq1.p1 gnl/TRDRNA2_/TRDRNA2_81146_c0~~gnl/TRDRNA2_/TRDRNA2_81146_c0_seq1.p1  ORF type:complete len:567 (+),score=116.10 gnl/TRDRNA2_/TRDRNA2_81146_c0_seq1:338-2038(+)